MEEKDNIYLMLGRIEGKLDHSLTRIQKQEEKLDHISIRVSALEKTIAYMLGAVAIITTGINLIVQHYFG